MPFSAIVPIMSVAAEHALNAPAFPRHPAASAVRARPRGSSGCRVPATECAALAALTKRLCSRLGRLTFDPPVAHIYNPLEYAREMHDAYTRRYAQPGVPVILLGMNPGPWGMVQTGIPFGEVAAVRDWLGIEERISAPANAHPKRPIVGLQCQRSEVSGRRLWGWARDRWGTPKRFFRLFFVANYCPLAFLEAGGRNLTPDRLRGEARDKLFAACDEALRGLVAVLRPRIVVGIGAFAAQRAREALGGDITVGRALHPSPASPAANRGWEREFTRQLAGLGISLDR